MRSLRNCSKNASRLRNLSKSLHVRVKSCAMLVWLASISPLTRCAEGTYGDLRDKATYPSERATSATIHGSVSSPLANYQSALQSHLDTGRSPGNEGGQLALAHALQALMNLGGVNIALNDVEQGDVTVRLRAGAGR